MNAPNNNQAPTLSAPARGASPSQTRLRHLADLVPVVIAQYRADHPAIEALADSTLTAAAAFRDIYDAARTRSPHSERESAELEAAIEPLRRAIQIWMGPLVAAPVEVDVSSFSNAMRSPRGIIADAGRMLELVKTHQSTAAAPLPFGDQLIADLTAHLTAAQKELGDVDTLVATHTNLQQQARTNALALHRQLIGLRRSLRVLLGRTHPHYRQLLVRPRSTAVVSDDELDDVEEGDVTGETGEAQEVVVG